ncbi:hypothetical protein JW948_12150 [bacterium]|nr:hypothetical protein [bacterium]
MLTAQITDTLSAAPDSSNVLFMNRTIPDKALQPLDLLNVRNAPLKDVFRGIAAKYNLSIAVDEAIDRQVTYRLSEIPVHEAILFMANDNGLLVSIEGSIYRIIMPEPVKPDPVPLNITWENSRLSLDVRSEPLEKVIYTIQEKTGKNIIINRGTDGKVTGFLQEVDFETGLTALLKSNGFIMRSRNGIYTIDRDGYSGMDQDKKQDKAFWIDVRDSLLQVQVSDTELKVIIKEASRALGINVIMLSEITGKVNADFTGLTFVRMLDYLFKGTDYTYRIEDDIVLIGDKKISGMATIRLIKLGHLKAEGIIEQIPEVLKGKSQLNIIKEHNAIMVIGSQDVIREVETYIRHIDYPIPQVLIEAIVIDFETTDMRDFSINAQRGQSGDTTSAPLQTLYHLLFPEINVTATGGFLNKSLNYYGPKYNVGNIGRLPEDFLLNLRMLQQKGKVNIRSNPQIATLNGHTAHITIGTTQYYKLTQETMPFISNPTNPFNQVSQRFEQIKAETKLEITPWVSATGEITTEIKPTFDEPTQGGFNAEVPPTINHKELESTVRLRDGETIVLGGLIRDEDTETITKFPILGDIPYIGKLFRNKNFKKSKKQLMIYITPHLIYSGLNAPFIGSEIQ